MRIAAGDFGKASRNNSKPIHLAASIPHFPDEIRAHVMAGARLVRFEICISVLLVTIRRQSPIYLTDSWQDRYLRGFCYSVLALVFGLWGVPWGLIWTPRAIWVNLTGGVDETDKVLLWLERSQDSENDLSDRPHLP
jgi:hypothetical protein